ncbi:MAG: sigma-54-dependent Fis family transcriptional regulator [Deltaproteobacteria bacterium HGW-Deltaproteobacteria-12]|nr:MAG: sigma-54-dependent Fis family transcriptional regulator [Deltaproteobacteria bacterium HGW-Deltaproteobacteria-12]
MKQKKFYVNLYILIPVIFTGIMLMGIIITYQLFSESSLSTSSSINIYTLAIIFGAIAFLASYVMMRVFLKPLVDFVEKTQKMPIFSTEEAKKKSDITDDYSRINQVFESVANILSNVEARELFPHIIGSSAAMRNIFTQIVKVAPTDSTVLITGESGTGKELIASSIFKHSLRKEKPFVTINCVAIPEGLLESELFGHEKGSFTGATARKVGKFEIADGGTVFLDEIGDMPMSIQAKVLRALQEKEFERVGGTRPIHVDIRVIAATNKDLSQLIKEGRFREDLYFRLNVFSILLPPLRDRREDISILSDHFLKNSPKQAKLSTAALQVLIGHNWFGNIRELKNVLERASIMSEDGIIDVCHLPEEVRQGVNVAGSSYKENLPLDERMNLMEKEMIISALKETSGVQVKAAGILGINQRSLWHRIKKHEIDVDMFKNLQ